ncbi:cupin-like domain-containing protein [Aegicerativicinus sediminis]|uniref:cupin-like domain-containing protein n=1 Tax=Aegicerativicinus sediminis TaxID=2893202 RepID=UPI001E5A46CA|nr:cupin-like domain-containing protein [Aegicerativicinus sediminis]
MILSDIDRVKTISKQDFIDNYYKPQKPLVIENFSNGWPAKSKWNFDYFKEVAGDKKVPLYDDRPVSHEDGFNQPHTTMKMSDYIDLLKREPTRYRIFLWNILREVPILKQDFEYPDMGIKFLKGLPMLFFGGRDSYTFMHYDIDLANIFHFHFEGQKKCILFDQKQTPYMYKIPHSLIVREDIDFSNPDFEKWPALKKTKGFITHLEHGDVLYMPEGYWHYMKYITPGFSLSLRSIPRKPQNLAKAAYNIMVMRHYDNLMRRWKGQKWIDWKNNEALERTAKTIQKMAS